MHGFNSVPSKVLVIERQNALDPMHAHCRHSARVMNLHTRDTVRYQKLAPFFVNGKAIREQTELFLKKLCEPVGVLRR